MSIWEAFFGPKRTTKYERYNQAPVPEATEEKYNFVPITDVETAKRRLLKQIAADEYIRSLDELNEANRKKKNSAQIVVGGEYPSMYANEPVTLKVTRIVGSGKSATVHFVKPSGLRDTRTLDYFCECMAHRIAYDNPIQSVDATDLFAKYGLNSKENSDGKG